MAHSSSGVVLAGAAAALLLVSLPLRAAAPLEGRGTALPGWVAHGGDVLDSLEVVAYQETGDRLTEEYYPGYEGRVQAGIESELLGKPLSWKPWIGHPLSSTRRPLRGGDRFQFQLGLYRFGKKEYQRAAEAFMELLVRFEDSPLRTRALYWLAESQHGGGQWEEAKKTHRILLRDDPDPGMQSAVLVSLGWISQRTGDSDDALGYYRRFLDDHPQSPATPLVVYRLGEVLYGMKVFDSAAEQFKRLSLEFSDFKGNARALFLRAESLRLSGACERARDRYREYLRRYPQGGLADAALYGLGWCSARDEDFTGSARIFQEVEKKYPHSSLVDEAGLLAGWSLLRSGDYEKAMDVLERHGGDYPHSPWGEQRSYLQAMSEFHAGHPGRAGERFALLAQEGEDVDLRRRSEFMEGVSFARKGEYSAATEHFDRLDEARGDQSAEAEALLMAGWSAFRGGEYEKAESLFGRYLRRELKEEKEAEALSWLGKTQAAQGKDAQAALSFSRALTLLPESPEGDDVTYALAQAYYRLGKWDAAGRKYRLLVEGTRDSIFRHEAMLALAECLLREGRGKEALVLLKKYLRLNPAAPGTSRARYLAGEVYFGREEYPRAREEFTRLMEDFPSGEYVDDARFHMAWMDYREGLFQEALGGFSEVVDLHPGSELVPMALLKSADARYRLRNYPEAQADYGRIIDEYPSSPLVPDAEYGRGLVVLARGKFDDYARASLGFVERYPAHLLAPAVLSQLGRQYLLKKRYGDAEKALSRLMNDYPGSASAPETIIQAARADRERGSRREERARLRAGMGKAPAFLEAENLYELANLHLEEGDCQGALRVYGTLVGRFPRHAVTPFALLDSAGCRIADGDPHRARESFEILTRDYGESKLLPGILFQWGSMALGEGDYEAAEEVLKRIPQGSGRALDGGAAFQLGMAQQKSGKTEKALRSFLNSLAVDPGGPFSTRAAYRGAEAARRLGESREALRLYGLIVEEGRDEALVKTAREGIAALEEGEVSSGEKKGSP